MYDKKYRDARHEKAVESLDNQIAWERLIAIAIVAFVGFLAIGAYALALLR